MKSEDYGDAAQYLKEFHCPTIMISQRFLGKKMRKQYSIK